MVVRQYKAKGKLTDILLPVVALDDAVGLVVFAVSFGVAKAIHSGTVDLASHSGGARCWRSCCSLALGAAVRLGADSAGKAVQLQHQPPALTIAFVLLTVAISLSGIRHGHACTIGFSSLLVCMMLGTVFCNICPLSGDLMEKADRLDGSAAARCSSSSAARSWSWACSATGPSWLCGRGVHPVPLAGQVCRRIYQLQGHAGCDDKVTKYLGVTLLPQAGVALGMCVTAGAAGARRTAPSSATSPCSPC